jgi:tartrate dehydrogenase/decarboxylase/D-malate dehydrogenase
MTREYRIAVIPGDGIGQEVIREGCKVLQASQTVPDGFLLSLEEFRWGSDYYLRSGRMMPKDALRILEQFDAIYFGAVGMPDHVPDDRSVLGLVLPIRKAFEQYAAVRPTRLLQGLPSRLLDKSTADIDFICVRENTEGEYAGVGRREHRGTAQERALQTAVFTRYGVERVVRFAFELARTRPRRKLTSVTKSNALRYTLGLWDEVFWALARDYPDVEADQCYVDAMAARMITDPESIDVMVASNLFGDILSDLGGAIQGSLGLPPCANLNPERKWPSMFEPVHGSAPDIAGKGIANPIAAIWAGALMLHFLGERLAAQKVLAGIEAVVADRRVFTRDLGGHSTTSEVGDEIRNRVLASQP